MIRAVVLLIPAALACLGLAGVAAHAAGPAHSAKWEPGGSRLTGRVWVKPGAVGNLDCNLRSPVQRTVLVDNACTDIKGAYPIHNSHTWDGRFYDNGRYIGHDEPLVRFLSNLNGSGDNIVWHETLGRDPSALPTVKTPGHDVNHFAELTIAPWFGMALCNPYSYPLLPCKPNSDVNEPASVRAPTPPGQYPGAGSSFLEMQFYPPGMAPFADSISCNNKYWCASLHINDAECSVNFTSCNNDCSEPTNFAFIQTNGMPTGPPSPQEANLATSTPNTHTLMMRPGDHLTIHLWDAPVPGKPGQRALETSIRDLSTGQYGWMQASAKNGFMATNIQDCSGTPFNYQPEYSTSGLRTIVPWAADQMAMGTEFEIGHFEACTHLSDPLSVTTIPGFAGINDITWNKCHGPYEAAGAKGGESLEPGDAFCYPRGDTHFGLAKGSPNIVTGCEDNVFQNGDLDFDGNSYWSDWPDSTTPNLFPSTFLQSPPTSKGHGYAQFQIQTDAALSEASCAYPKTAGCKVPPPAAPGKFYPYWTLTKACVWEFGNMTNGDSFGRFAQYGRVPPHLGYAQLFGPIMKNRCLESG